MSLHVSGFNNLVFIFYALCYLTFLSIHQFERTRRRDIQSKVEELEELNQSREKDKTKDIVLAYLFDQLLSMTTRLQEIERKQQLI